MIARTDDFKEEIAKMGRQIDFKIDLFINDRLITQDGKYITTEANNRLIVEQFDDTDIDESYSGDSIYNVTISNIGTLLSTMMKEIDFEIREELRIGDIVDCNFGLKVGDDYEWINYGKYIIYSKEYNEDTNTYTYVSYDSMLLSMITFDDRSLVENVSVKTAIENICNKIGLSVNITAEDETNLPNLNKIIHQDTFKDIEMTYRDVLDMICQCLGVSMVSNNKVLYLKRFNRTAVDSFDENYLKDTNITFGQKYGPINSVVLSRSEDNDNLYRKDDESIALNGLHEFKIKDNLIMLYDDREDYINEIFDELNGIEYYENDFYSTGITYLEWLDFYNITRGNKIYNCLMLNDEIKIKQGLEEHIYTELPEQATTDYKIAGKTDKEVSFIVDKQNSEIKSRVTQGDMESYVSEVADEITAQVSEKVGDDEIIAKLNLAVRDGQGIVNLIGNTVTIDSDKFSLDEDGIINATGGKIGGCTIDGSGIYSGSGNNTAGIGLYNSRYAFWAGGSINDTGNAVFSVGHGGQLKCSNAQITGGSINLSADQTSDVVQVGGTTSGGTSVLAKMGWAYFDLYRSGVRNLRLHCGSSDAGGVVQCNDGSGNTTITLYGPTGHITCVYLTQTSLEDQKKNFEKYENALDTIKDIDIYKYNYKNENDKDKKHIGFVIGDKFNYSNEITSLDENKKEDGVELYSFVSVCCKAIQEQQEIIENLTKRIEKLEEGGYK